MSELLLCSGFTSVIAVGCIAIEYIKCKFSNSKFSDSKLKKKKNTDLSCQGYSTGINYYFIILND